MYASSGQGLHTNVWISEWRQFIESGSRELPASLRSRLLDPLKVGDPVFATVLSKELCAPSNLGTFLRVLALKTHSAARILQCEILFYLCKCPVVECRVLMANVIPTLLAIEWLFSSTAKAELARSGEPSPSGEEDTIDVASLEEDINAIEVAILAAYQQDYNVSPMAPTIRLHSFTSPSIYMRDASLARPAGGSEQERGGEASRNELFPFSLKSCSSTLSPLSHLYPSDAIDKFDDYTRKIVTYRLCKSFQEQACTVHDHALLTYIVLAFQWAIVGTGMWSDLMDRIRSGAALSFIGEEYLGDPSPDGAAGAERHGQAGALPSPPDAAELAAIGALLCEAFATTKGPRVPYPLCEDLALLWGEMLAATALKFPRLAEQVRAHLYKRASLQGWPAAILALS